MALASDLAAAATMRLQEVDFRQAGGQTGREVNPRFQDLDGWVNVYLGPATASFHGMQGKDHAAIPDENRNAIIPARRYEIDGRTYYLSIKGCRAYEDMFHGGELTPELIAEACRDRTLLPRVNQLPTGAGFIMGESWMGESPFGAQGERNARDELSFSTYARGVSINGAYICPVIGIVPLAGRIEETARKFYWFRQHPEPFYQEARLVPSRTRLYFESSQVLADPVAVLATFGIDTTTKMERFEKNFIKSGFALLSLFTRSAVIDAGEARGIIYRDVWLDKDAIVAPDGVIHFADLEGLDWLSAPLGDAGKVQRSEWDKLFFEFSYALVQIDVFRRALDERATESGWDRQREALARLIQDAMEGDPFVYTRYGGDELVAVIEHPAIPTLPQVRVPLLQGLRG
jgi:hypothetical protein